METFVFAVNGVESLRELQGLPDDIEGWKAMAVNKAARDGRTMADRRIRDQVNFSASYLAPSQKRLFVSKMAKKGDAEAVITARGRPTSLARFATSKSSTQGVTVQVSPGKSVYMKRAFMIKLRAGTDAIETRFNMGLAVRLKPGESLRNKKTLVQMKSNLYILYGPSVSQVFLDQTEKKGVSVDITPDVLDDMEREFLRLMELD